MFKTHTQLDISVPREIDHRFSDPILVRFIIACCRWCYIFVIFTEHAVGEVRVLPKVLFKEVMRPELCHQCTTE